MGSSHSKTGRSSFVSQCDDGNASEGPPPMRKIMTVEEKMWAKVKKEPLVPIGCAATAYFLMSGIKSFQNQDPRKGQKMMRLRVGAQFATLAMFAFYVGLDKINFEIAPQYQRSLKAEKDKEERLQQQER